MQWEACLTQGTHTTSSTARQVRWMPKVSPRPPRSARSTSKASGTPSVSRLRVLTVTFPFGPSWTSGTKTSISASPRTGRSGRCGRTQSAPSCSRTTSRRSRLDGSTSLAVARGTSTRSRSLCTIRTRTAIEPRGKRRAAPSIANPTASGTSSTSLTARCRSRTVRRAAASSNRANCISPRPMHSIRTRRCSTWRATADRTARSRPTPTPTPSRPSSRRTPSRASSTLTSSTAGPRASVSAT